MKILTKIKEKLREKFPFSYSVFGKRIYAPPGHKKYKYMQDFKNHDIKLSFLSKLAAVKYPKSTILDIGANIGNSLAMIKEGAPKINVICIEANLFFYKYLIKNVKNYINTICLQVFVSEIQGTINVKKDLCRGSTIYQETSKGGERISSSTLAEILVSNEVEQCSLIKTDTDGFDFKILKSSIETIKYHKPLLFFEYDINWNKIDINDSIALIELLYTNGYSFIIYDNYGNYMQYVKEDIVNTFENLNIYILQTRKYGGGYYYSDILAVHKNDNDILNQILEYEVNSAY